MRTLAQSLATYRPDAPQPDSPALTEAGQIFGLQFSALDEQALVAQMATAEVPSGTGPKRLATANLDHIVQMARNDAFRRAYDRAWTITADGMPVYLYARLRNVGLPGRVTGADLFARLIEVLNPARHRCFFVCSSTEVAERLEQRLLRRGFRREALAFCVPPHAFEGDAAYSDALAERIRRHAPTHLFMGLGAPKSDIWTDRYHDALGDCYVLNVGAALDFTAGVKRRAPVLVRRIGLEWAWRVASEPRRLYRRYFVDSWQFLWLVAMDLCRPAEPLPSRAARDPRIRRRT